MKTILITGGCGFIGKNLIKHLLGQHYSVISIDVVAPPPEFRKLANVQYIESDFDNVDIGNLGRRIDCVIHLAASAGVRVGEAMPGKYTDNNVTKTVRLFHQCVKYGIKNIMYASSSSVYGNTQGPHKESTTLDPANITSVYGMTKYHCECYADYYATKHNMNIMGLRLFTVYGEYGRDSMAVGAFSKAMLENRSITVNGDGTKSRSFTYVGDVVKSMSMLLCTIENTSGHTILNIGTSSNRTVQDVIDIVASTTNVTPKINYSDNDAADVDTTLADVTKLDYMIGCHPQTSLEEGIGIYIAWLKKNGYFVQDVDDHILHAMLIKKGSFPKGERDEPYQEYFHNGFWRPGQRSVVHRAELMNFAPQPGDSVLELGTQMGGFLQLSILRGANWVEGLDYEKDYVDIATQLTEKMKSDHQHVRITHGDMCNVQTLTSIKQRIPKGCLDHLLLPSLGKHVGGVKTLKMIMDIFNAKTTYVETNAHGKEPEEYTKFVTSRGGRLIGCTKDRNTRYVYVI